ncbi:phage tail-collar fiber domain-containing protein [Pseudomonas hormoni]
MSQTYFALLTAVGEAKLANATALGTQLQISRMAVGDGNGVLPVPIRTQTALVHETYRADLNELKVDPLNASQIIAELVIPETEGGYWLREMGLYDAAGDLIAVANCPPSYKPQLAEGSGRTQIMRMVLIVSSTTAIQLKIDPSIVLATRAYADAIMVGHLAAADPHPQYTTEAEVNTLIAAEMNSRDSKQSALYTTTANINLNSLATQAGGDWAAALAAGARILVKDQAVGAANGLYVAAAGAWTRAEDADASAEVTPGTLVTIEAGTAFADTVWELTTNGPITLGTTALTFELTAAMTATQADAETGTNNVRRMTALRVFQAIRSAVASASELLRGVLRIGTQAEVNAGTLDDVAVTPKKLRWGFSISLLTNGYVVFPSWMGGLILQWGTVAAINTSATVSFPLAFPNAVFYVNSSENNSNQDGVGSTTGWTATLTAVTFYATERAASNVKYFALGH